MSVELVGTPSVEHDLRKDSIDLLKRALVEAQAGDVKSVIVILKRDDNFWSVEYTGVENFADAIGQIEIVQQEWIADARAEREGRADPQAGA